MNQSPHKLFVVEIASHISKNLFLYEIIQFKKTCHWTNKSIEINDSIKDPHSTMYHQLKNNNTLWHNILHHFVKQHHNLLTIATRELSLSANFTLNINNIKTTITNLQSIHPSCPLGNASFENLHSIFSLGFSEEKETQIYLSELKKLLSGNTLQNDIPTIKNILSAYKQFPNHTGILEGLCKLGDVDIIDTFLSIEERGIDFCESYEKTALYFACQYGNYKLAKFLIERGAIINNRNILQTIITYENVYEYSENLYNLIELLLQNGANPNYAEIETKTTALHYAAQMKGPNNGNKITQLLIKHNANITAVDQNGHTPFHYAYACKCYDKCSHAELVHYFLQKGVDLYYNNTKQITALHMAAYGKNIDLAEILLKDTRTNVNAIAEDGRTPLHCAAREGSKDMAELLLKYGADTNALCNGETPLSIIDDRTSCLDYYERKQLLLNYGGTYPYIITLKRYANIGIAITGIGITMIALYKYLTMPD